jgi:hypothetical protein
MILLISVSSFLGCNNCNDGCESASDSYTKINISSGETIVETVEEDAMVRIDYVLTDTTHDGEEADIKFVVSYREYEFADPKYFTPSANGPVEWDRKSLDSLSILRTETLKKGLSIEELYKGDDLTVGMYKIYGIYELKDDKSVWMSSPATLYIKN